MLPLPSLNLLLEMQQLCIFKSPSKQIILMKMKKNFKKSMRTLLQYNLMSATSEFENSTTSDYYNLAISESDPGQATDITEEECYPFLNLIGFLNRYYIPFIITIGLIGNILSFLVFMTSHLKLRSSSYFMAALAVADFGFLSMLLLVYLSNETKLDIFNKHGWCQWIVYVSSTCSGLSAWYIVAFTTERFIAVEYPLQRPYICTVHRAKIITTSIAGIAMCAHMYTFWTAGLDSSISYSSVDNNFSNIINNSQQFNHSNKLPSNTRKEACGLLDEYENLMLVINIIDTFLTLIIPVIAIVVMNTMLARNLFLFRRRFIREEMFNEQAIAVPTISRLNKINESPTDLQPVSYVHQRDGMCNIFGNDQAAGCNNADMFRCIRINTSGRSPNAFSLRNQQNITKTLLLLSTVYICLNIPSYALRIYVFFFFILWKQPAPVWLWCLQQIFMTLYYTHFSVNFLLYSIGGATFRRCLANIFNKFLMKLSRCGRRWCKRSQLNHQQNYSSSNGIALQAARETH